MCRALGRRGWIVCYAFMLAFFLVMVPSLAYADTYVATEDSAVRAAMVYLGYDPDEGESTNKLVTAFYDATSGDEYTGWQSFVNGLYQPLAAVNYNNQWWSPADGFMFSAQVDAARSDAAKIYAAWKKTSGGSGGGSGGGLVRLKESNTLYLAYGNGLPATATVNISSELVTLLNNRFSNPSDPQNQISHECNLYITLESASMSNGNLKGVLNIVALPVGYEIIDDGTSIKFVNNSDNSTNWGNYYSGSVTFNGTTLEYRGLGTWYGHSLGVGSTLNTAWNYLSEDTESGGGSEEPEPEPEPEPPTPPEPPVDPTPPAPDPTQPSQTVDLQGIIDRLDIIIRNQVVLINWLDDAFASVNQNIQWLGDLIDESFGWLWEVLEKLQVSIDGGINRITTWLEMIYRKIGGQGGTVSRPNIDTPSPWDDFLSWLGGILQSLLDKIFGLTPQGLQDLLSGLADLTGKFPFSIPWDLAGLIALFVHEPVTPVFDLPLYMPFEGTIVNFHIDLSTWDDVMQIARDGEVILFAAWLIMATPDFYKHLNSVSGSD